MRWNLSSRVHKLNSFPDSNVQCYVKRDDELGCGISGSKIRKYASLIPFLIEQKIRHVIIIASSQSNNLLAALQVARELKLEVTAFLLKPRNIEIQGNFKLSLLFLEEQNIVWVARDSWPQVNAIAQNFCNTVKEAAYLLYEGASVAEALPGAMSLADDIVNNEKALACTFQHIFIDAGTGFSAAALLKRLVQIKHPALVHVLLLADDDTMFCQKLVSWIGMIPNNYHSFYPSTARSFGAVNQIIKKEIKRVAMEEGILVDPIYSAKLFYESRKYIESKQLKGNVLIIHSGGILTMPAFTYHNNA